MSDKTDEWLDLYRQHRPLFEKAMSQKLSLEETAELQAVVARLDLLKEHLDWRVEVLDPHEVAAIEAAAIFDAHYRKKAELDRKFFGEQS